MKTTSLISLFLVLTSFSAFAQGQGKKLIKTCSTVLVMPGNPDEIETKIEIFKKGDSFTATVTQKIEGQQESYEDVAEVAEHQIQEGLKKDNDESGQNIDGLNLGESLIVQAMTLTQDPSMEGKFNAGFDLKKVSSAKVYTVGKPTHMGLTAIVEAKDKSGKALGSFFGGFVVTPCK
ncbi:MAG: hypothetical protein ACXVCP_15500 [Bdellovibrio sp.]